MVVRRHRRRRQCERQSLFADRDRQGQQRRALPLPRRAVQETAAGADGRRLLGTAALEHRARRRVGLPARIGSDTTRKGRGLLSAYQCIVTDTGILFFFSYSFVKREVECIAIKLASSI